MDKPRIDVTLWFIAILCAGALFGRYGLMWMAQRLTEVTP